MNSLFPLIIFVSLSSACGPQFTPNNQLEYTTDALTEGQNSDGRFYTSFSPPSTVQNIKEQISLSDSNRQFASNIESIEASVSANELTVKMKWKSLPELLVFHGNLQTTNSGFSSQLKLSEGPRKDLEINANCESLKCEKLNAFLKDQNGNLIGFIVKSEKRVLTYVDTKDQKTNYKLLSKEKQSTIATLKKGLNVSLKSVETYPGKSYFEVKQGENAIEGELLSIDAGAAPTKTRGSFQSLGKIELVGNNQGDSELGAELQFKITDNVQNKEVVSYLKMDSTFSLFLSPMPRETLAPQNGVHPLVQQILSDESNEILKAYIDSHLSPKPNLPKNKSQSPGVEEVSIYLACEEGNQKICNIDKPTRDRVETAKALNQILRQNGLPAIWSLVSFMESRFDGHAYNSNSGALGYWQFLYSTAADPSIKLIRNGVDLRTDLKASTEAAVNYFKLLFQFWNGDVKMSIISYNMGQGAVAKACLKGSEDKTHCNIEKNHKLNEHRELSELYSLNKEDFWRLYKLHSFGAVSSNAKSGQEYILKFLSESLVSLHPLQYGYGNHAVEPN